MIPFAFMKPLILKCQKLLKAQTLKTRVIAFIELLFYACFGLPFLFATIFSDFYYFWANNFRSNLKKIIIERKKSTLQNRAIRQIKDYCWYSECWVRVPDMKHIGQAKHIR